MTIESLNRAAGSDVLALFLACCGSREWAARMNALRPFASRAALLEEADRVWLRLGETDWLEAFAAHPRIGEHSDSTASRQEQATVFAAGEDIRRSLALANAEYDRRFGFIFIVFAADKTAEQMLDLLNRRINNDRRTEIANAAAEQMKITRNRLGKLVDS